MAVLKFADLQAEANEELATKSLEFVAKDGKTVLIRPFMSLTKDELKVIQTMLPKVQDDKADPWERIEAMDTMLVAAADKKDSLKKSLSDLPPAQRAKVFEAWMEAAKGPEASA